MKRSSNGNPPDVPVANEDLPALLTSLRQLGARADKHSQGESAHWAREILSAIPAAIYTTDADGYLTYYNERAAELWGYRPEIGKQRWCGTFKIFLMDGTPVPHDQCPMATAVRTGGPVYGIEAIGERPDGRRVPCAVFPAPMFDESGKVVGGINMLVDISERKAIEDRQSILIREMDHRIRNNLAKIKAIMGSTIRTSTTREEFEQAFLGRIHALEKTNALLMQRPQDSVSLRRLLDNELEMYRDGEGGRIACSGPEVAVPPHIAVPLGMAFHELATNAAKYGALSALGGTLSVRWDQTSDGLNIRWREHVPSLEKQSRIGFGTQLLTQGLPYETGGKVEMKFDSDGVAVIILLPLTI
jgi:PAS domain S-box-containing protein